MMNQFNKALLKNKKWSEIKEIAELNSGKCNKLKYMQMLGILFGPTKTDKLGEKSDGNLD